MKVFLGQLCILQLMLFLVPKFKVLLSGKIFFVSGRCFFTNIHLFKPFEALDVGGILLFGDEFFFRVMLPVSVF